VYNFIVAGIADHITPWQNRHRSTQLLGGDSRFILSASGHIAALVNPPGNPKASNRVNKDNPGDPQHWLRTAETKKGSWWPEYVARLGERCGPEKPAPEELGGGGLRPSPTRRARTSSTSSDGRAVAVPSVEGDPKCWTALPDTGGWLHCVGRSPCCLA
jgi:hypothetical protein